MATDNIKVLKIDTGEAQTSVKDLRTELKALKDTMLSTQQGTDEYNQALQRAAEITHELKEQTEEVNASAMDFGQITSNVVKSVGGMVAGFQAAKATMNLFGVENETVIKSLEKMQNLMAITQAIPSIDSGVKAFKRLRLAIQTASAGMSGLKKAIISTGLGALAVALGLIIANFDKISAWLDEITGQTDFLGNLSDKVIGGLNAGWAAIVQSLKAVGNAIVTYVTTPFKAVWNAIQAYTSTNGGFADKLKAAGKAMKDGFVSDWKGVGNDFKKIGEVTVEAYNEGVKKANAKRTAESEKERKERLEREKKAAEEEAKIVAEIKKRYASLSEEIRLYNATELEKQLDEYKKLQEQALKTLEDAHKKRLISDEQYEKEKLSVVQHYAKLSEKAKEDANKKAAEDERKKSIELIDTSYQLEQAKLKKQFDEKFISEKDYNDRKKELLTNYVNDYVDNIQFMLDTEEGLTDEQILDLTEKINSARSLLVPEETTKGESLTKGISEAINASALALNDFSNNPAWGNILKNVATLTANWDTLQENIKKGGKEAFTSYAQIAATALSAVAQMMNGLAAEQDTSNKEGFEQAKKYQIAGATMSMLAGIASAWASSMQLMFPANVIIGSVLSAMMLGTGIAQIQKIKSTQFGGNGSTSAGATPNTAAVQAIQAPVQYTQDVQGASIEGAIKDTKVYVTETDISNTQNKVEVTENEAKY